MGDMDHTTPSSETIKLIIDKALLESEARTATSISTTITDQNKIYMTEIVTITEKVAKLDIRVEQQDEKIKGFKVLVGYIASASVALGGLVGFFISQLVNIGSN